MAYIEGVSNVATRVERGVEFLDRVFHTSEAIRIAHGDTVGRKWYDASVINLRRLDMGSSEDCVAGQVFGEYGAYSQEILHTVPAAEEIMQMEGMSHGVHHGFFPYILAASYKRGCEELQQEWTRRIIALREGA